jgi:hypothetical protein
MTGSAASGNTVELNKAAQRIAAHYQTNAL